VPLVVSAFILVGFLVSAIQLPAKMRAALALDPMEIHELLAQPFNFAALLIMGTTFLVAIFYCLDALHGERRDRSILFWKSLPVSDLITIFSKLAIPLVVLPLVTFAITFLTQWVMLLLSAVVLQANGLSVAPLWNLSLFQMQVMTLYHLLTIHALWYAPFYAWLLLVSAWARRLVILWAALPLLLIGVFEKIAFNTSFFAIFLGNRLNGGPEGAAFSSSGMSADPLSHLTPLRFLISPGLWIGLAVSAVFVAATVRVRRHRGPL